MHLEHYVSLRLSGSACASPLPTQVSGRPAERQPSTSLPPGSFADLQQCRVSLRDSLSNPCCGPGADFSDEGKGHQAMGSVLAPACQCCCAEREDAHVGLIPVGVVENGSSLSVKSLDLADDAVTAVPVLPPAPSGGGQAMSKAMGSVPVLAYQCCCEGEDAHVSLIPVGVVENGSSLSLVSLNLADDAVRAVPVLPPAPSSLLKSLEGRWYLKTNLKPLCQVWNSQVFFDPSSKLRDTLHFLNQEGPDVVSLQMGGQTFYGRVSLEAQAAILWDHGETWIKQ